VALLTFLLYSIPVLAQEIVSVPAEVNEERLRGAADDGDPEAMYIMAALCFYGRMVEQDYKAATAWLERAADRGLILAQYHLAQMYEDGKTIPENDEEAFLWYSEAARQGLPQAQYKTGLLYEQGKGTPKNHPQAVWSVKAAAEQGFGAAQNMVGMLAEKGGRVDLVDAYKWYVLATAGGFPEAASNRDSLRPYLTSRQIADAQRLARAFTPKVEVDLEDLKEKIRSRAEVLK